MKRSWAPALAGVVAGVVTVGAATLLAGVLSRLATSSSTASPVVAVGGAFVDRTPPWLKDFAVNAFGTRDKLALFVGMGLVLAILCALIGWWGARRPVAGLVAFALLGAVGAAAVLSRPGSAGGDVIPTVVGTLLGLWTLSTLWGRAGTRADVVSRGGAGQSLLDRRGFLAMGGVLAALGVVATAAGQRFGGRTQQVLAAREKLRVPRVAHPVRVPSSAQLSVPGISPYVVSGQDFYRIDTALVVPQVDPATWRIRVHGMVRREVTLTWDQLLAKPMQQQLTTLTCVSNEVGGDLVGNAVWTGWPVREILAEAGVEPGADMVLSRSEDGWTAGTPLTALTDDRNALLAVGMNGRPLPLEHGFPVRLVVPGLYGYVSATKWVVDLKLTTFARDMGYWTDKGWSARGPIKTASRIDVPRSGATVDAGTVAVAGVAWAQHRGIDKVEVRVDDGPWRQARLAAEPSIDAWRQWVLPWEATHGSHTLSVRATDGDGNLQTSAHAIPAPNGASGWHTVTVTVR
ncbi:molybdopterin-dependent oxidoreductase [Segeticoccus rhizosphaerae]|uniref:molybdopterin-dependent oxidoreductase n=1 Tax=Segeticoccus rhizosphaerae TaxID=1104777 RepID=UPI0010C01554|nr:molybdopterin-dependent oxidoreductase [Ornithinicoccus soli]